MCIRDRFKIELVAPEFKVEDIVLVNEILDLRYAKIDAESFDNAQKSRIIYSDKEGKNDIVEENYLKVVANHCLHQTKNRCLP